MNECTLFDVSVTRQEGVRQKDVVPARAKSVDGRGLNNLSVALSLSLSHFAPIQNCYPIDDNQRYLRIFQALDAITVTDISGPRDWPTGGWAPPRLRFTRRGDL